MRLFWAAVLAAHAAWGQTPALYQNADAPLEKRVDDLRAVKAGTDLDCGNEYRALIPALEQKLIVEADIDAAVRRLLTARFRLGMFDPPERVPYARIPYSVADSAAHQTLALEAARKSIVLLKNQGGLLPLKKTIEMAISSAPKARKVFVSHPRAGCRARPCHPDCAFALRQILFWWVTSREQTWVTSRERRSRCPIPPESARIPPQAIAGETC